MVNVKDVIDITRKLEIDDDLKSSLEQKYKTINEIYRDLAKEYLDFREIADKMYDAVYVSNGEGYTIYVNKAFTESTGIQKDKVVGKNVQAILNEGKLFKGAVTMKVIETKKEVRSIARTIDNNKEFLVTGKPILDDEGNVRLVVVVDREITYLKELENIIIDLREKEDKTREEIKFLRSQQLSSQSMTFEDKAMKNIYDIVKSVGPTDTTVLITGESGTGKEVIADMIYNCSTRKDKPFIKVNCSAIPPELVESELFGYEGGAFTDADKKGKIGLFELANNGTILLDEIGDMPLNMQSKILRVLQQKEIIRVGGISVYKINIRVIASTNKDLAREVKEKKFREDLFYRLNVVPIHIPPLRQRKEDLKYLIDNFLEINNKKFGKEIKLDKDALNILQKYEWPGNIRELENFIERMVVISKKGVVDKNEIAMLVGIETDSTSSRKPKEDLNLKDAVQGLEKEIITAAIKKYGSTRKAAEHLGIDQSTIVKKCKKIGLSLTEI
jgi:PAS domain S-box-containing protein